MVRPMKHPFAVQASNADKTDLKFMIPLSVFTAGLNKKFTTMTRTAFPIIMRGMIPGTAVITGEAAIINAVTGVMIARMIPHISPAAMTASMRHRLTIGPVI